jgi:site-specific DNA-methyltransferase (adenine-specific)
VSAALIERRSISPRKEVIGNAELWLGDCREILPDLQADHIITDPPYSANTHAMAKTNRGAGTGRKLVNFACMADADFDAALAAMLAAAAGWVVATCDYRHAARHIHSEKFVRLGAWVKPNPMPQISADRPGQGFETVLIMHSGATKKAWNRGGGAGVWTYPVVTDAEVPTQKPLKLVQAFVSDFTQIGQTVLDPFMGSGTTGVAALSLSRRFIGIDREPAHFDVACRRIEAEARQGKLF